MIGQTVAHYKILEKLGQGGMGEVFLAEDTRLGRRVALKFLPERMRTDSDAQERLLREARAASKLDHPNIVTIYGIEQTDEHQFIVMAYVDGEGLKECCSRPEYSVRQMIDLSIQMADGLHHAHRMEVVHRDLKPSNVMVDSTGRARILDFGIAKLKGASRLTATGSAVGTLAYASPEQAQGHEADALSDIYSLGVVMYQLLSGQLPFDAEHEAAMLYAILNEAPRPITDSNSSVPASLQRIVFKCLEKQPEHRYASCAELATDLRSMGGAGHSSARDAESSWEAPSIAVLPFANMSADPDNEFFSDGLAEEIINALTGIPQLRVAARTSAFSFKHKDIDVREIGRKLNVDTLLEGSVRRAGKRLRVTAQLIKTLDGYHLWSERYDRELDDVFEIQDQITHAIVDKLKIRLLGDTEKAIGRRQTENVDALTLYMKGRFFWNKRTESNFDRGVELFQQALELDPGYARAHVGLADAHNLYGFYSLRSPGEAFSRARESALRALELDDQLAEAHTSLAYATFYHDWNWDAAESGFLRAQELNPAYAFGHGFHGNLLAALGRHDEAWEKWSLSLTLDPLALIQHAGQGWALYHARDFEGSLQRLRSALDMDPSFMVGHLWLARTYEQLDRRSDAIRSFQRAVELSARMPGTLSELGRAYAAAARTEEAREILAELESASRKRYVAPFDLGLLHMALGDRDRAYRCMFEAVEHRCPDLVMLKVEPRMDPFRADPRFAELVRAVGLPA